MKELTDEEKNWLLCYCMKSENIEISMAIGQFQIELREKILRSFANELKESVEKKLKESDRPWKSEVQNASLETGASYKNKPIYTMKMDKREIQIHLVCGFKKCGEKEEEYDFWVEIPSANTECPPIDLLGSCFPIEGVKLDSDSEKNPELHCWLNPKGSKGDISTLHHDNEKIAEFSRLLVRFAGIISKKLEK